MEMSPATALAYNCKSLEKDSTSVESLTVDCGRCDPDNPLAIPRKQCPECKGTGRAPVALATIVTELKASRLELLVGGRGQFSDD
jgi:hypothetical protein